MTAHDSILFDPVLNTAFDTAYQIDLPVEIAPVECNKYLSIEKVSFISDWAIVLITLMLLIVVWIRISSEKYFYSLFQSSFNYQTANRLFRERTINIMHPSLRLDILFFIVAATFLMHIEHFIFNNILYEDYILLLINFGIIIVYINGKYLLYRLTGFLFKTENETSEYTFYLKSGNRILSVFLLPFSVLLFFTTGIVEYFLLFLGVLITLFFSVIGLLRGVRIIAKKDFSIYYLILYLCTLEILPLLIVWRILW